MIPIPAPVPHTFTSCYDARMARLARVIVPDCPHHVTQRGNRREPIFFEDGDQEVYRGLLAEQTRRRRVQLAWGQVIVSPEGFFFPPSPNSHWAEG